MQPSTYTFANQIHKGASAYFEMVRLGYRPMIPSERYGTPQEVAGESETPGILKQEAWAYVDGFLEEEDVGVFFAGCTDLRFLRAVIWALEAIRIMNEGTVPNQLLVPSLLRLAAAEYERELKGVPQ